MEETCPRERERGGEEKERGRGNERKRARESAKHKVEDEARRNE